MRSDTIKLVMVNDLSRLREGELFGVLSFMISLDSDPFGFHSLWLVFVGVSTLMGDISRARSCEGDSWDSPESSATEGIAYRWRVSKFTDAISATGAVRPFTGHVK